MTEQPSCEELSPPRGWLRAVAAFVEEAGLGPETLGLLTAFGRAEADAADLFEGDFETLEAWAHAGEAAQAEAVVASLDGEVDAGQARMFARRFRSVATLLDGLDGPGARVLRVGLWHRLDDILAAPAPRALRVRAVVDFYYSQGAVLLHQRAGAEEPTVAARAQHLSWSRVAPGVAHALLEGPTDRGPVHVNLLRLRGVRLATADTRGVADFAGWVRDRGAVAGTSGGFFLYSEADIQPPSQRTDPVGLLVSEGEVLGPPVLRRSCLLQDRQGRISLRRVGPEEATILLADGRRLRPVQADEALSHGVPGGGPLYVRATNRAEAEAVALAGHPGFAVVGRVVVAAGRDHLPVPLNGLVLRLPPGAPLPAVGSEVRWELDGRPWTAVAGGPRLLRGGQVELSLEAEDFAGTAPPVTFSQDETFDQNLLPRLAVGLRPDETLFMAAMDGRNMDRAPGFTLRGAAELLAALGCTEAVNLDGGSSKRMVVQGTVVDLPSTEVVAGGAAEARVRPVHTAVLVYPAGG